MKIIVYLRDFQQSEIQFILSYLGGFESKIRVFIYSKNILQQIWYCQFPKNPSWMLLYLEIDVPYILVFYKLM